MPFLHDPQVLPSKDAHEEARRTAVRLRYRQFVGPLHRRPDWDAAKRHLSVSGPLIVMAMLPASFFVRRGAGARGQLPPDYWPTPEELATPALSGTWHAMICVGYDDSRVTGDNRGAFRFRNSFGPQWRDKGSVWIPYAFFERLDAVAAEMAGPITFVEAHALHDPEVLEVPSQHAVELPGDWADFGARCDPPGGREQAAPSIRQISSCACDLTRAARCTAIQAYERSPEDARNVVIGDREGVEISGPWILEPSPRAAGFFTKVDIDGYAGNVLHPAHELGIAHQGRKSHSGPGGMRKISRDTFWVPRTALAGRDPLVVTLRLVAQRRGDCARTGPSGFPDQFQIAKRLVTVTMGPEMKPARPGAGDGSGQVA